MQKRRLPFLTASEVAFARDFEQQARKDFLISWRRSKAERDQSWGDRRVRRHWSTRSNVTTEASGRAARRTLASTRTFERFCQAAAGKPSSSLNGCERC